MDDNNNFGLSRRQMLGGLGMIGVASAGAGLGTTAYFSDEESFEGNTLTAGELDLIVDYETSYDQGDRLGSGGDSGTINGTPSDYSYELSDVKPGDSGSLVFCPKVVDNPAWLWIGSENGAIDYENGQTEPEAEDDNTGAGTIGSPNDGEGEGELSESIQVTVSYCEYNAETEEYTVIREMNNPEDYTLADLADELEFGFFVNGGTDSGAYPPSEDGSDQQGPCLCIDWELPTEVGNEVQTDAVEFDFEFYAEQERHNENPASPYATGDGFSSISFEKALNMQALARGGSGRGEIQVHSDSGGVEDDNVFGSNPGDVFPANQDIGFVAQIDTSSSPPTASLEVNGQTVVDTDVTDGTANGAATGDPEWQSGVPSTVDVALTAYSANGNGVETVVKDVQVNGSSASPSTISSSSGAVYLAIPSVDTTSGVTVTGNVRFEGSENDYTTQDWMGVDFR